MVKGFEYKIHFNGYSIGNTIDVKNLKECLPILEYFLDGNNTNIINEVNQDKFCNIKLYQPILRHKSNPCLDSKRLEELFYKGINKNREI